MLNIYDKTRQQELVLNQDGKNQETILTELCNE